MSEYDISKINVKTKDNDDSYIIVDKTKDFSMSSYQNMGYFVSQTVQGRSVQLSSFTFLYDISENPDLVNGFWTISSIYNYWVFDESASDEFVQWGEHQITIQVKAYLLDEKDSTITNNLITTHRDIQQAGGFGMPGCIKSDCYVKIDLTDEQKNQAKKLSIEIDFITNESNSSTSTKNYESIVDIMLFGGQTLNENLITWKVFDADNQD